MEGIPNVSKVTDVAIGGCPAEGEGVAPEPPLEYDDGVARRDGPNEGQRTLSS